MGQTVDNYGDTKTEVLNAVNVNGKSTKEDADEDDVLLKKDVSRAVKIVPVGKRSDKKSPTKKAEEKRKSDDKDWELVPPDGGWGWLILGGSMLINLLVPGTVKSFGVLFAEFLQNYQDDDPTVTESSAAWIPALCYFLYSSLGPISSILSIKYSYRTVTLLGGTFAAVGMMLSFFATSVPFLCVTYGVFVGTGAGLSFPPTVYIVTSYFVRLRGLANGICISGSAFGSIFLPPLLRFLVEEYGVYGSVLIMGGVLLNTWVAAIFYEPVENHMKRVPKEPEFELGSDDLPDVIDEEDEGITLEFVKQPEDGTETQIDPKPKFVITSDDTPASTPKASMTSPDQFKFPKNFDNNFARSASAVAVQNLARSHHDDHRQRKISTPVRGTINNSRNDSFINQLSSTPSLYAVPESRFSHSSRLSRLNRVGGRPPKRSPSTSSFQYMSTPFHGSTLSFQPEEFTSHLSLKSIASSINPVSACTKSKTKNKFLDLSLLKDPIYLVILLSNSTNAIGYTNFIILLPLYAFELDFSKDHAAYLLSIVSALDLVGRIGGAALSDVNLMPKTFYFVGGLALSGFSLAVLPFASSYSMLSFWCALFGLASGTYVGTTAVIMADMLGTERLVSSYGISLFVNGILQLVGPPLCGLWHEYSKSYTGLFTALGLCLLSGASLWISVPFIKRSRRLKEQTHLENIQEVDDENVEA